jgi:hypothetical protein
MKVLEYLAPILSQCTMSSRDIRIESLLNVSRVLRTINSMYRKSSRHPGEILLAFSRAEEAKSLDFASLVDYSMFTKAV